MTRPVLIPIYTVDAFTAINNELFTGNPAAICLLDYDDDITDEIKQKIAQQMNLSETAFVAKNWIKNETEKLDDLNYTLRWFTPTNEVELCGHATLAAAMVAKLYIPINTDNQSILKIAFHTKFKGILDAQIDTKTNMISLNFPINACESLDKTTNSWIDFLITNTLGNKLHANCVQDIQYSFGTKKLLLRLNDSAVNDNILSQITPNFDSLKQINTNGLVRGVIVTVKCNDRNDIHFMSRYFSPWNGINEDPVTGSAHTVLAPYWLKQLRPSLHGNDQTLIGLQCSPRTGLIHCRVVGDRVILSGTANLRLSGELRIV